VQVVAGKK
jgi:alpha-tubulin suppressor-like RCC1 family protein